MVSEHTDIGEAIELPAFEPGWVWLAGAGPGDPGLLTLAAYSALQKADVIVHDALVDERVLKLARTGARLVHAGKRGGKPSPKQIEISQRLVEFARQGNRVLRLKGGDPFTFGRGSEEAEYLVSAGIPFRIIPGVTAGLGGLAYAGIPATDRRLNHVVTFLTGHAASGDVPDAIDWQALAKSSPVIVIYMGTKHLPRIAGLLIGAGRNAQEPVAIISKATTAEQSVIETVLGEAGEAAARAPTPAIIVIGEVVRLRAGMDWLGAIGGRILTADPLGKSGDDRVAI
ncbi:MAG: uroporphyrinogen-III C-methyltransferase [Alphaproteobacteria bacterium]